MAFVEACDSRAMFFFFQYREMAGATHASETEAGIAAYPGLAATAVQPDVLAQQQTVHRLPLCHHCHQRHPVRHESSLLQRLCNSVRSHAERILHDVQVNKLLHYCVIIIYTVVTHTLGRKK